MKVNLTLTTVSSAVGIFAVVGAIFWGLFELVVAEKLHATQIRLTSIETKVDMLLEERLVEMEHNELYRRMKSSLPEPSTNNNQPSN